jgi:hypothetical protein
MNMVGGMSAFDSVLKLLKKWEPEPLPSELSYRDSLVAHLRQHLSGVKKLESEYRHLGTTTDIYVKQSGFWGDSEVYIELKRNLTAKGQLDRLVGQIESLEPKKNAIIVVLCGITSPALTARLRGKYGVPEGLTIIQTEKSFQVVEKPHSNAPNAARKAVRQSRPRAKDSTDVNDLLNLHKRTIKETRIANNLYPELRRLRDSFLRHGLADKSKVNRNFFDAWLADPIVEMGLTPAGGWTRKKISELHADLDTVHA